MAFVTKKHAASANTAVVNRHQGEAILNKAAEATIKQRQVNIA